jgi:hypothetical protein
VGVEWQTVKELGMMKETTWLLDDCEAVSQHKTSLRNPV